MCSHLRIFFRERDHELILITAHARAFCGTIVNIISSFLTHWFSEGKKVSHCYGSQCCYGEPTCTGRVVQFEVVDVAIYIYIYTSKKLKE